MMNTTVSPLTTVRALESLVAGARTYSLAQSELGVDLNRVEAKFILPLEVATQLCQRLAEKMPCLCVNHKRVLSYRTDYLDTPAFDFFHQHQQKRPRRIKVRLRHYLDTQSCYLEIKQKDKAGITHKFRRQLSTAFQPPQTSSVQIHWQEHADFVTANTGFSEGSLSPSLRVDYQRICFKDPVLGERVSFDFGVAFHSLPHDQDHENDHFHTQPSRTWCVQDRVIVELKVPNHVHLSYGFNCLKEAGLRETSVSKYCVGLAALCPDQVKYNGFKPALLKLGLSPAQIGVPYERVKTPVGTQPC